MFQNCEANKRRIMETCSYCEKGAIKHCIWIDAHRHSCNTRVCEDHESNLNNEVCAIHPMGTWFSHEETFKKNEPQKTKRLLAAW